MGGYKGGALAGNIATDTISQAVRQGRPLVQAIHAAHEAINRAVKEKPGYDQMGTTVIALNIRDIEYEIAWAGDSRAYLWNGRDHTLDQLSRDHSYVAQLLAAGKITPEEASRHPHQHVLTSCLGAVSGANPQIGHSGGTLTRGTSVLLCSDGMTDLLSDQRIAEILQHNSALQKQADALVVAAQQAGSKDDISVLIIAAPEHAPASEASYPSWLRVALALAFGAGLAVGLLLLIRFLVE